MIRPLLLALSLFGAAALACGNPGAGCGTQGSSCAPAAQSGCNCNGKVSLLETVTYAIDELGLSDNGDIRTAITLFKREMRSLQPHVPTEAFDNGTFNPEVYAKNATPAQALKAQTDLFETIYLVLNDEQKKSFPQLMGMYQHHMQYAGTPKMCGPKGGNCCSKTPKMCDTPPYQGCGGKNYKAPMTGKMMNKGKMPANR